MPEFVNRVMETNFSAMDLDVNLKAAFKVLATKLEPLERAVFLLKEVFDHDYDALQQLLDKKKEHCRQLLSRAKKKLSEEAASMHFEFPDTSKLLTSFKNACAINNSTDLIEELKNDIGTALQKKI